MDKLQDRKNHSINCYSKSLSGPTKSTFKIYNYRMKGIYNYRAKSTIAVLHFEGWIYNYRGTTYGEEESLMMKAEKESDVVCCRWWRLKRKPWAVEEIVTAVDEKEAATVDEKEAATVSTDDWSEDWTDDWSEEKKGVKTGPWPWPWLSPLLWLPVG